jgi:sugar lactone lactonase YvrE
MSVNVSLRSVCKSAASLLIYCVMSLLAGSRIASAQSAQFDGTVRPVLSGLYQPIGVAVDQYGDLFVADTDTFQIIEVMAVNGSIPANPTTRQIYRDSVNPQSIAVDQNGNLFLVDYNDTTTNQTIKEIVAVGGSIPLSPTVMTIASGFSNPQAVAADLHGNVYVAQYYKGTVYELLAVNGNMPPSPTVVQVGSGFSGINGITVDTLGDLYVAERGDVKEVLAVNGSIPLTPTVQTLASGYCSPSGVALDPQGNLYFSDYCNATLYEIQGVNGAFAAPPYTKIVATGQGLSTIEALAIDRNGNIYAGGFSPWIPQIYPADLGSVQVGTSTGATPLAFTFTKASTLGSISVLTQGQATEQDFVNAGAGTCSVGTAYSVNQVCTVNVAFSPKFAGARPGAVLLKDTSGNTIASGYVHGTGVAPLVNFARTQSTVISNVPGANGVAIDASGNLYIAATSQNQILKETLSGGSYVQSVIPTSTLSAPAAVAVDSAGIIYIADSGNKRVLKETPSSNGYTETIADGFTQPAAGVVVDQDGHDDIVWADGFWTGYQIDGYLGMGLMGGSGIAVDSSHNLYFVYSGNPGVIQKETLTGSNYAVSVISVPGIGAPGGIAFDAFGNLYVSYLDGSGAGQVAKLTPSPSGYVQTVLPTSGLKQPAGIAIDALGNVFVADAGNGSIVKIDASDPSAVSFDTASVGSVSVDSPHNVALSNAGNADLTFTIPSSGTNPRPSASFTIDENAPSACPVVGSGSSLAGVLAAGSSCVLPVSFQPLNAGSITGSLAITDNNLFAPAPYAIQTIALSGTGTPATPVIAWTTPSAITYGTALSGTQLDATANAPGTFSYTPAFGIVLGAGVQTLKATFIPTDTVDYTTATATVQLTVNKATPTISWPTPVAIAYGTALSSTQLNATSNVAGKFIYSPGAGTVLPAGSNTLSVTFTPTDSIDYNGATASVTLVVNPPPTFTLSASPSSVTLKQGASVSSTVAVNAASGFTGSVSLSISVLPRGVTATLTANPTMKTSTLKFTATNGATIGTSVVTVSGKSGSVTQSTTISLTVAHK